MLSSSGGTRRAGHSLMEVNARIGGALDSVTSAGIDLPVLFWQWATGQQVQRPNLLPHRRADPLAPGRHQVARGQS